MHPQTFANAHDMSAKACSAFSVHLTPMVERVWDDPHRSPSTMSAAALTHCAKFRMVPHICQEWCAMKFWGYY